LNPDSNWGKNQELIKWERNKKLIVANPAGVGLTNVIRNHSAYNVGYSHTMWGQKPVEDPECHFPGTKKEAGKKLRK